MAATDLRVQANQENVELGSRPADCRELEMWRAERRGALVLMAALGDNDAGLLRRAASGEWVAPGARDLLIDAAQECK